MWLFGLWLFINNVIFIHWDSKSRTLIMTCNDLILLIVLTFSKLWSHLIASPYLQPDATFVHIIYFEFECFRTSIVDTKRVDIFTGQRNRMVYFNIFSIKNDNNLPQVLHYINVKCTLQGLSYHFNVVSIFNKLESSLTLRNNWDYKLMDHFVVTIHVQRSRAQG